ncbi:hypothetical protein AMTRI_Chr03g148650 [Amborella trichopoda]
MPLKAHRDDVAGATFGAHTCRVCHVTPYADVIESCGSFPGNWSPRRAGRVHVWSRFDHLFWRQVASVELSIPARPTGSRGAHVYHVSFDGPITSLLFLQFRPI